MLHLLLLLLPAALAQLQLAADVELSLRSPMVDSFTCDGRAYGYYADQGNNCQLFHICMPVQVSTALPGAGHWHHCSLVFGEFGEINTLFAKPKLHQRSIFYSFGHGTFWEIEGIEEKK